jgi:hypothetical protein
MSRKIGRWMAMALLAGCGEMRTGAESPATAPDAALPPLAEIPADTTPLAPQPEPEPSAWTIGITRRQHEVTGAATMADVRIARNEGFDRLVIEFVGDELPAYHVEYVDRPIRQCGSGDVMPVAGDGWLAVRLEPARGHDDEYRSTIAVRTSQPELPVVRQLTQTCDFEAQVEWVLGVRSPNPYRILELAEPTRLVVDVRH